jgi:hypothetical protein
MAVHGDMFVEREHDVKLYDYAADSSPALLTKLSEYRIGSIAVDANVWSKWDKGRCLVLQKHLQ